MYLYVFQGVLIQVIKTGILILYVFAGSNWLNVATPKYVRSSTGTTELETILKRLLSHSFISTLANIDWLS